MGHVLKKRILVVEDCQSDVFLLEHMLSQVAGHNTEITSVGRLIDAFQLIDDVAFDVILLDLNLMDIDGIASVAAISAEAPYTPVIVYSGMGDRKVKEAALLCGAREYLVKGQEDGHSLQNAIGRAISGKQYRPPSMTAQA